MSTKIDIETRDGYLIIRLEGDYNTKEDNSNLLTSIRNLAKKNNKNIIIDLTKVIYLDSESIGVLLSGNAILKKKDGKLVLFGASDYLDNIFNITRLNLAFDICKTEEEAIRALK